MVYRHYRFLNNLKEPISLRSLNQLSEIIRTTSSSSVRFVKNARCEAPCSRTSCDIAARSKQARALALFLLQTPLALGARARGIFTKPCGQLPFVCCGQAQQALRSLSFRKSSFLSTRFARSKNFTQRFSPLRGSFPDRVYFLYGRGI